MKIVDEDSNYTGRVFLITDNKRHCVTLDTSRLAQGESTNLSTYFPVGTKCEVVPAPTLGSTFGISTYTLSTASNEIPQNWTAAVPDNADWIYLWDVITKGYEPYFFIMQITKVQVGVEVGIRKFILQEAYKTMLFFTRTRLSLLQRELLVMQLSNLRGLLKLQIVKCFFPRPETKCL